MVDSMNNNKTISDAVDYIYTHGKKYADCKSQRIYLENYTKSLIASLSIGFIKDEKAKSMSQAEAMAYADISYQIHIKGLQEAVRNEETFRWGLIAAQARIEIWRSEQANARAEIRNTQ